VNATFLVLMLVMVHAVLLVLLFTFKKSRALFNWFYLPSLLVAWIGYFAYEGIYIPLNCTGDCNIRVDLLLIYPYLAFASICTIAYFVVSRRANRGARR
jgi:hypothetical protein